MAVRVRPARSEDETEWRALWLAYNNFYKQPVPREATDATWSRILDERNAINCLIAEESGQLLGFIHYIIHPRTWSAVETCYMEDLFVDEKARGKGIARKLFEALKTACHTKGADRIYWNTQEGNRVARAFYDQIGKKDDFIRYITRL